MQQKFLNHINQNFPFLNGKKLLLATSGGLDSMVMVDLFQKSNYAIAMAHCNFQLRGIESFQDEKFVQDYAASNNIRLFVTQFDTEAFAKDYKLSTQVAARELRYNWFYELLETENFDYILTAHHADDNLETFLINFVRGTGLEGLTGIPSQNENVIRPLLVFSRNEIENYAKKNFVEWREDSSNASDKYLRNKIRHKLVPILNELNPDFLFSFQKTQNHLKDAASIVNDGEYIIYQEVVREQEDGTVFFNLKKLTQMTNYKAYLYQWLKEFDFSDWASVYDLVESQSGKQVLSTQFRLLKNRDFLILTPVSTLVENQEYFVEKSQNEVKVPLKISFCKEADISLVSNASIFVDEDKLQFPLVIRRWNEGNIFQPFGMKGKTKKVSKLFKDEKLSLIEKENTWILCSDNQIVWIIGIRQDERFKIDNTTKNILKIELQ
ncbi:tRNA lysidine(34) synthetase TilS [Flavobacterium sp.]|uniref:tRNA lysidine(34) synthetase TilS n=1 Tax=Flavobacterium sp. TaxID=239 RepID=UPI00286BB012|nr:tRNA lysidine(34) synthetase TilS [Flavobacterium sp.]